MTLDYIFRKCTGKTPEEWSETGDLDWYASYANGDDAGKGVLVADWNDFPHGARKHVIGVGYPETIVGLDGRMKTNGTSSHAMRRFESILEKAGYKLEWSDQTSRCEECNSCITDEPDYYGDTPHYALIGDCSIVCEECSRTCCAREYVDSCADGNRAVSIRGIDPTEFGYVRLDGDYESGFHPGQIDDPREITKRLRTAGYNGILFRIDDSGQFDVRFSVYAKRGPGIPQCAYCDGTRFETVEERADWESKECCGATWETETETVETGQETETKL